MIELLAFLLVFPVICFIALLPGIILWSALVALVAVGTMIIKKIYATVA